MQLNQDNCADEAVDAAFLSKEGKTAWEIVFSRAGWAQLLW